MRYLVFFICLFTIASCTVFEAGKLDEKRKHLHEYNNNQEYCDKNPTRCVNGIPW